MKNYWRLIQGILLVAGTSIGGGMLALPVLTSRVGFFPSLCLYLACWLFMACTGLLFLEISLWMPGNVNILSMAQRTLGPWGKAAAWVLYLFLFYCLTLAYIVGAGDLIVQALSSSVALQEWQGELLFLALFAPFVYAGTRLVGRLNIFLMLGLGLSYLAFVFLGSSHVNTAFLLRMNWSYVWTALPITFVAFAYQGIVPTLVDYMQRDVRKTRLAIVVGSFLPFIAYAIWQWLILGIVPAEGAGSLNEALQRGETAVEPLKNILDIPGVYVVGQYFAFFALVTSFFGVTLGLMDFLADGIQVKKTAWNKFSLCLLIFIPPFLFALIYPHVFLIALDFAGGLGCALLLGLLPILMTWMGRYRLGLQGPYRLSGGRWLLAALLVFVLLELGCELFRPLASS